jgi:hypothetical protein
MVRGPELTQRTATNRGHNRDTNDPDADMDTSRDTKTHGAGLQELRGNSGTATLVCL